MAFYSLEAEEMGSGKPTAKAKRQWQDPSALLGVLQAMDARRHR